jgi:hypothetical protein
MASFVYNSALENAAKGAIDFDTDTFKMLLVTSSYSANKDTHEYRDDVTNEVANGNGYTTGGAATACTVARDAYNRITITFAATNWTTSTITAAAAVVYKSRGGASSADELVFYNDFGGNVSSSNATFSVGSTVMLYQN